MDINRYSLYWGLILVGTVVTSCTRQHENDSSEDYGDKTIAHQIVSNSIARHGGLETWKGLRSISYSKTTTLFDSSGHVESTLTQYHKYNLLPELSGSIFWETDTNKFRIEFYKEEAIMFVNDRVDTSAIENTKSTVQSSLFVLFQPFKLWDEGTELRYLGKDSLEGIVVDVIQPVYGGKEAGRDQWWFYFDSKSNHLIANMVNHNGKYSYIKNLAYDTTTNLVFNAHRKSYFVDSIRTMKYLRAEYFYKDFKITY